MTTSSKITNILKRRCGVVYTALESEYLEKIYSQKKVLYQKLDPILHKIYEFKVISRKRQLTLLEKTELTKLQTKKEKILKVGE